MVAGKTYVDYLKSIDAECGDNIITFVMHNTTIDV